MSKHEETLAAIFEEPTRANIAWRDVEAMFVAFGARVRPGRGSRVRVSLNGRDATFHRPHPQKEISRPGVRSIRMLLTEAGVEP
jgi:hypothetical protein